jgi:hypothetical protein
MPRRQPRRCNHNLWRGLSATAASDTEFLGIGREAMMVALTELYNKMNGTRFELRLGHQPRQPSSVSYRALENRGLIVRVPIQLSPAIDSVSEGLVTEWEITPCGEHQLRVFIENNTLVQPPQRGSRRGTRRGTQPRRRRRAA